MIYFIFSKSWKRWYAKDGCSWCMQLVVMRIRTPYYSESEGLAAHCTLSATKSFRKYYISK